MEIFTKPHLKLFKKKLKCIKLPIIFNYLIIFFNEKKCRKLKIQDNIPKFVELLSKVYS